MSIITHLEYRSSRWSISTDLIGSTVIRSEFAPLLDVDYPMRGRPVFLHMRKNKWWDKQTNEIFSYNLELPNDEGTRLSAEFVAFLKDEGGDDSPVD